MKLLLCRFFAALALLCAMSFAIHAEENSASNQTLWPAARFSLSFGPGGFYSSSSNSPALLFQVDATARVYERLRLGLAFNGKAHPWESYTSFFGTAAIQAECDIWRGLFAAVSAGPAWNMLKNGSYQESAYGWGALAQFGWRYAVLPHFTLEARAHLGLRGIRGTYLDYGLLLGPGVYF